MFKFLDKVGLEIEACWPNARKDLVPDGSMRDHEFKNPYFKDSGSGKIIPLFGELISEPMASKEEILEYLDRNRWSEVGPLCGYHVHFSFKKIGYYCACMNDSFYKAFLENVNNWGIENCLEETDENSIFWQRLENKNKYCADKWIPDTQAKIKKKVVSDPKRYCIFNFCWGMHRTIECRLFPTFLNVDKAKSATIFLIDFIESYLEKLPQEKFSFEIQGEFDEDNVTNNDKSNENSGLTGEDNFQRKGLLIRPFNLFDRNNVFCKASSDISERRLSFKRKNGSQEVRLNETTIRRPDIVSLRESLKLKRRRAMEDFRRKKMEKEEEESKKNKIRIEEKLKEKLKENWKQVGQYSTTSVLTEKKYSMTNHPEFSYEQELLRPNKITITENLTRQRKDQYRAFFLENPPEITPLTDIQ